MNAIPILTLKVTLRHTLPPIWRRLTVPGDITLVCFDPVIQAVMGWTNSTPHYFEDGQGTCYSTETVFAAARNGRKTTLWAILNKVGKRMTYHFGFEEDWEHDVRLEAVVESPKRPNYAECLGGKRRCPPDNCGGPLGFRDLLEAIASRRRSKPLGGFRGWIEGRFDPTIFEPSTVNSALRRIKV